MSKTFFEVAMSLDGFIAGPNGGPKNPLGDGGMSVHQWMYGLKSWRQLVGLEGGVTNDDDKIVQASGERTGAYVMGKNMFIEGEANWPANAPFHAPVYVLTHQEREPWVREGGTTFYFITDGIEHALEKAKEAAGGKDVKISGGAAVIQQCLNAGLVDEFMVHVAPVMLGRGTYLFKEINPETVKLEIAETIYSPKVTHLKYNINH